MVNLDGDTKRRFKRLQPDDCTQGEFVALLLDHYELTDSDGKPDVRRVLDRLDELDTTLPAACEVGAYRGAKEAIDKHD